MYIDTTREYSCTVNLDPESANRLKNLLADEFKEEIKREMVDLYNYLAFNKSTKMEIQFDDGLIFRCEIDDTHWKNKGRG